MTETITIRRGTDRREMASVAGIAPAGASRAKAANIDFN
jgi:hypothetical protein